MTLYLAKLSVLTVFAVLALAPSSSLFAAQEANTQKKAPAGKKKAASQQSSLSGCVDQKEGHYILVDDRNLSPLADLEADGFPTEGFAKHVGHKVIVRGTSTSGNTSPLFKVRSIETVSDTCAPTPQSDKQ